MNSKVILVFVSYRVDFNFFYRFKKPLEENGYKLIFITNNLSIIFYGLTLKIKIKLIKPSSTDIFYDEINDSVEILANILTKYEANRFFHATYSTATKLIKAIKIDTIFILNGGNVAELAMQKLAKENNIKLKYFELANLPNKIFVDNIGVNAKSSIYKNINKLESYFVPLEQFNKWRNEYIIQKKKKTTVPQGERITRINNYLLPLDSLGYLFLRIPFAKREKYLHKLKTKLFKKNYNFDFDKYDLSNGDFIFYPMQVKRDSQLCQNSNLDNLRAIKKAFSIANERQLKLIIKPHPAEADEDVIKELKKISDRKNVFIVNYNSYDLIINSKLIVTINSTIGLEAMILQKEVKFLGRTFFSKLNQELLKNYILKYLVDIDYFGNSPIPKSELDRILSFD